jgi:hypothetical protein
LAPLPPTGAHNAGTSTRPSMLSACFRIRSDAGRHRTSRVWLRRHQAVDGAGGGGRSDDRLVYQFVDDRAHLLRGQTVRVGADGAQQQIGDIPTRGNSLLRARSVELLDVPEWPPGHDPGPGGARRAVGTDPEAALQPVQPMLAARVDALPDRPGWAYELKFYGWAEPSHGCTQCHSVPPPARRRRRTDVMLGKAVPEPALVLGDELRVGDRPALPAGPQRHHRAGSVVPRPPRQAGTVRGAV